MLKWKEHLGAVPSTALILQTRSLRQRLNVTFVKASRPFVSPSVLSATYRTCLEVLLVGLGLGSSATESKQM